MSAAETYLKGRLISLQREFQKRAEPIIEKLAQIEAGKPPRIELITPTPHPPRWAFEEIERERCVYLGCEPNPANIDVWIADPIGWATYHAWAASIERREREAGR